MDKEFLIEENPTVLSFKEIDSEMLFWLTGCNVHISKEHLAEILIAYTNMNLIIHNPTESVPLYDEKQYLQFGEDCFNAARRNNSEWYYRYKNFSDFMNKESEDK